MRNKFQIMEKEPNIMNEIEVKIKKYMVTQFLLYLENPISRETFIQFIKDESKDEKFYDELIEESHSSLKNVKEFTVPEKWFDFIEK